MTADHDGLQKLREPFPSSVIGKLPKGNTTLDFVGHAAVTDRLLSIDPLWNWEPLVVDERGFPARDPEGALWIRLTVCGVTRLGVSDPKDTNKVAIGDAIRNAAMRFGVALDLWTKDDLESQAGTEATRRREDPGRESGGRMDGPPATPGQHAHLEAIADLGRITASWDRENDAWRFEAMARLRDEKGWPKKVGEYTRSQAHEALAAAQALDQEPFPVDPAEVSQEVPEGIVSASSEQPAGGSGVELTDAATEGGGEPVPTGRVVKTPPSSGGRRKAGS